MAQNDERGVVSLRDVTAEDLLVFFEQQLDPTAHWMAAFGPVLTDDPEPFLARWERILNDDTRVAKTILWNGEVAGNVTSFQLLGDPAVGYWLGREYWGKGIATRGLAAFLEIVTVRPLYARAAQDNVGSLQGAGEMWLRDLRRGQGLCRRARAWRLRSTWCGWIDFSRREREKSGF